MSVEPLQGALPWLRRLNANKIACAVVSTVRRVEESFIAYAVVACLAVFLPVALGVPWGGNAEARVYLGEYLGWN